MVLVGQEMERWFALVAIQGSPSLFVAWVPEVYLGIRGYLSQKVGYGSRENVLSSCFLKQMKPYPSPLKGGTWSHDCFQAYSVWWVHRYKRGFQQVRTSDEPTYFSLVWRIKIKIWNLYDEIDPDHKIAHYSYCRNISRKPYRFTDGGSFCLNKQYRISSQNEIPGTNKNYPEDRLYNSSMSAKLCEKHTIFCKASHYLSAKRLIASLGWRFGFLGSP